MGPVALSAGAFLIAVAPLWRGGNRYLALIALELLAIAVLVLIGWSASATTRSDARQRAPVPMLLLLAAPAILAVVQLLPLPPQIWSALAGRGIYVDAAHAAGMPLSWHPLSLLPSRTAASLLASLPLIAAFLLGRFASATELRIVNAAVVAIGALEVLLAIAQASQGSASLLNFGVVSPRPLGTFANSNHLANFLAMALTCVACLAFERDRRMRHTTGFGMPAAPLELIGWLMLAGLLLVGIFLTRSRGASLFGLPAGVAALLFVALRSVGWRGLRRYGLPTMFLLLAGAIGVLGIDLTASRASVSEFSSSALFRGALATSSATGAWQFFPWGSGWGTYQWVYPQFQPESVAGLVNHAHMDYVEFLFEGGVLFLVPAGCFVWLAISRTRTLITMQRRHGKLGRDAMLAALCGLGLLGFLLHSLVDFSMRIPANAILACYLAGVFLRPVSAPRGLQ